MFSKHNYQLDILFAKLDVMYLIFLDIFIVLQDLIESPARCVLHEGDLLELDPTEGTAMQRMHAFLFNDGLLLAPWIPNRYKFSPHQVLTFFYRLACVRLVILLLTEI